MEHCSITGSLYLFVFRAYSMEFNSSLLRKVLLAVIAVCLHMSSLTSGSSVSDHVRSATQELQSLRNSTEGIGPDFPSSPRTGVEGITTSVMLTTTPWCPADQVVCKSGQRCCTCTGPCLIPERGWVDPACYQKEDCDIGVDGVWTTAISWATMGVIGILVIVAVFLLFSCHKAWQRRIRREASAANQARGRAAARRGREGSETETTRVNISLEINRERDAPPSYEEAVHYNATLGVVNLGYDADRDFPYTEAPPPYSMAISETISTPLSRTTPATGPPTGTDNSNSTGDAITANDTTQNTDQSSTPSTTTPQNGGSSENTINGTTTPISRTTSNPTSQDVDTSGCPVSPEVTQNSLPAAAQSERRHSLSTRVEISVNLDGNGTNQNRRSSLS